MRQVYAARILSAHQHRVSVFCPAAKVAEAKESYDPSEAVRDADAVLLPIPACGAGGAIRGTSDLLPSDLLPALSCGCMLFGGNLSASLVASARERGIKTVDYLNLDSFVLQNAYLTAQAALGILLTELESCLFRMKVAVIGFGRIGKFLTRMLTSLGAEVTVFARKSSDLAMASLLRVKTLPITSLGERKALMPFRVVINTAPARILKSEDLFCLADGSVILELASGSDNIPEPPEGKSIRLLQAQGLPGKCFPESAGEIVARATEEALSLLSESP